MPLTIEYRGPYVCPIVVCDACGKKIDAGTDGNYEWDADAEQPVLYFSHKHCTHHLRAIHSEINHWTALSALPAYLAANLRLSWEETEAAAELAEIL